MGVLDEIRAKREKIYAIARRRRGDRLLRSTAVPRNSFNDAMHIAIAATNGMDMLVTWNCTRIANAETLPTIRQVCASAGFSCPEICTPYLTGGTVS